MKKTREFKALVGRFGEGPFPLDMEGSEGIFRHLVIHILFELQRNPFLIVYPRTREMEEARRDWELFETVNIKFPEWNTILYGGVKTQQKIQGERLSTLGALLRGEKLLLSTSLRGFLTPLPPTKWLRKQFITLKVGDSFDPMGLEETLSFYGYDRVPRVSVHGEFALRGEVLDVFLPGMEEAVRIVFDFEEIEAIRLFSPADQTSTAQLGKVELYPAREALWSAERIQGLRSWLEARKAPGEEVDKIIEALEETGECPNEEILFPFSFPEPARLQDYLPQGAPVLFSGQERLQNSYTAGKKEAYELFLRQPKMERILPKPNMVICGFQEEQDRALRAIRFFDIQNPNQQRLKFSYEGPRSFFGNMKYLKEELVRLEGAGYRIGIFAESEAQAARIRHVLKDFAVEIFPSGISQGFSLPNLKFMAIQENEIFGRKKRPAHSAGKVKSQAIDTFVELNPGDLVVHINYGIGRFLGIDRIKAASTERDYIKLEYAGEETIFIPIEQVNLVQRYIGNEGRAMGLDMIGGKAWEKRKNRVRKNVEDLAEHLIKLYSRRKEAQGFVYGEDTDWQIEFEAAFPYEETPDQLTVIAEIKKDMETPKPMDRLLCGDVGYGKTEVAMRAAFKAVVGGKQVAILAPTTILAEQHLEKFIERFDRYPVKIGMISRFVTPRKTKAVAAAAAAGDLDILIGTHRILQKDVKFKNLGLIIIDEEQRFGVKQKERLREMKHSVDALTLSATPIPRTLHMSLLKIRDMSLLTTAPSVRRPIETYIREFDEDIVAAAIRKETARGGQVFYLHNRVETLEQVESFLRKLVPEVFIEAAHGQMAPRDLEDIMHRFVHGAFQVLLATTIIENGIDIPNVNTIIIDRADMYGISQLYQLRGRVGRSNRQAYAYLLYPEQRILSERAMKRLQVISDFTELGAGFKIAMKDLEVRGAGNLLGREQSGDVLSVGFDMYMRLLDEAIRDMISEEENLEKAEPIQDVYLELEYTGFIPDNYIKEPTEKMEVYKKISSIQIQEELDRIFHELEDRFGPLPEEVASLLSLAEIRIICGKLRISSLRERQGKVEVEFARLSLIAPDKVLRLIQEGGDSIALDARRPQVLILKTRTIGLKEKSEFLRERLSRLV